MDLHLPRQRGGLLPIEGYRRASDKVCAEVGIDGLVPHGLQHTTASLANLGRRNQNLVRRQLALISEFEREELDPGALANLLRRHAPMAERMF